MLSKRGVSTFLALHILVVWGAVALRIDRFPMTWAPMYSIYRSKKAPTPQASKSIEDPGRRDLDPSSGDESKDALPKTKRIKRKFMLKDKKRLEEQGWLATRRDGSALNIGRRDINVARRNMWRLYYKRTFGRPPPKYDDMNYDAGTWDRWLWGLQPGEDYISHDWRRRLLKSINKTYGLRPDDPQFIVSLEAHYDSTIIYEDGSTAIEERTKQTAARWDEAWAGEPW